MKNILLISNFFLISLFTIYGESDKGWVGNYSSVNFGIREEKEKQNFYYFWEVESWKNGRSPEYVAYNDIHNYTISNKLYRKGILFSYKGIKNKEVLLCGNFLNWKCEQMRRNQYGVYTKFIEVKIENRDFSHRKNFEYKFKVDGLYVYDPSNLEKIEDNNGSFYSLFYLDELEQNKKAHSEVVPIFGEKNSEFRTVLFQIYSPNSNSISLVGNFNRWDGEMDQLIKNEYGLFYLKKKLRPGEYIYNFIIDGKSSLDIYNEKTRFKADTEEICSYLLVE